MFYFIAIVLDENIRNGTFWPAYVLCRSWTTNEKRSGWRVIRYKDGLPSSNLPKVLVTEVVGHEPMIQFLSSYQKMDYKTKKHYHPYGALCWFSCNQYGDPQGEVYFIKKVPEWRWIYDFSNRGFQQLKKTEEKEKKLNELFTSDVHEELMKFSDTRMRLHQQSHKKDLKDYRRKRNAGKKANDG